MIIRNKLKLLAGAAAVAATLAGGIAQASPISFNVQVWTAATTGAVQASPSQQAVPTNPIAIQGNLATTAVVPVGWTGSGGE